MACTPIIVNRPAVSVLVASIVIPLSCINSASPITSSFLEELVVAIATRLLEESTCKVEVSMVRSLVPVIGPVTARSIVAILPSNIRGSFINQ